MGQYLQIGVTYELTVKKEKDRWSGVYTQEELLIALSKNLDLDLFDIQENEEYVELKLKKDVLLDNIKPFLMEQYEIMADHTVNPALLELLDSKDYTPLIQAVEDKCFYELQLMHGRNHYLIEPLDTTIHYKAMGYLLEGKAYLECYTNLFIYLNNLIKRSSSNPLKGAIISDLL